METHLIPDDDGKGFTRAFIGTEVEFVDPEAYMAENRIKTHITLMKDILFAKDAEMAKHVPESFYIKRAEEKWSRERQLILDTKVPDSLIGLLTATSKKEQTKLLRGVTLTAFELHAFIFKAAREFGYTYSSFPIEQHHKGLDESKLPTFINVKETGEVKTVGETSLTEGQLRKVVDERRVVICRFIEKDDLWHCFFVTYRSLKGQESWNNNQPHFHYISDKWGLTRDEAIKQFKGEKYPTTSVHVGFEEYENPKLEEEEKAE